MGVNGRSFGGFKMENLFNLKLHHTFLELYILNSPILNSLPIAIEILTF